ncbi:hypothetical protein ABW19_dt0208158 [Dactylella cylindrospora]|nr:hypothetical protein ABW19_dt0208158 [Dactylella cylindrospora]
MPPILKEANEMIEKYGYTMQAFSRMSKMDSFSRECSRFISLGPSKIHPSRRFAKGGDVDKRCTVINTRTAKVPYTLRDGTYLPPGAQVCMPHHSVHNDPRNLLYGNAHFDGFRFHNLREQLVKQDPENADLWRAEMWTATSTRQLFFGNGKHSCPGRFFASMQLKMVLHYLLSNYKIEADPMSSYDPLRLQTMYIPNPAAEVRFTRVTDPEPGVMDNNF